MFSYIHRGYKLVPTRTSTVLRTHPRACTYTHFLNSVPLAVVSHEEPHKVYLGSVCTHVYGYAYECVKAKRAFT